MFSNSLSWSWRRHRARNAGSVDQPVVSNAARAWATARRPSSAEASAAGPSGSQQPIHQPQSAYRARFVKSSSSSTPKDRNAMASRS